MDTNNDQNAAPAADDDAHLITNHVTRLIADGIGFLAAREAFGDPEWRAYIEAWGVSVEHAEMVAALAEAQADPRVAASIGPEEAFRASKIGLERWPGYSAVHNHTTTTKGSIEETFLPAEGDQPAQYYCQVINGGQVICQKLRDIRTPFELGMATVARWGEGADITGSGFGFYDNQSKEKLAQIRAAVAHMRAIGVAYLFSDGSFAYAGGAA